MIIFLKKLGILSNNQSLGEARVDSVWKDCELCRYSKRKCSKHNAQNQVLHSAFFASTSMHPFRQALAGGLSWDSSRVDARSLPTLALKTVPYDNPIDMTLSRWHIGLVEGRPSGQNHHLFASSLQLKPEPQSWDLSRRPH